MSNARVLVCPVCASVGGLGWLLRQFDRVPYAVLALPLRLAVATVFWNSGMTKLADWNATLSLFTDEYQVPLLPPELAANLAFAIEVTTPVLLVFGLLTRAAALALLGMTAVMPRSTRAATRVSNPRTNSTGVVISIASARLAANAGRNSGN